MKDICCILTIVFVSVIISACAPSGTYESYNEVVVDGAKHYVIANYTTAYELKGVTVKSQERPGFLIGGILENKPMYYFYYKEETSGGHKLGRIPVKDTVVFYIKEDETPHIEQIDSIEENCNGNIVEFNPNSKLLRQYGLEKYRVYIPEDSIVWELSSFQSQEE